MSTLKSYLQKHNVEELMAEILEAICIQKPENVPEFIISQCASKQEQLGSLAFSPVEDEDGNDREYTEAFESFQKDTRKSSEEESISKKQKFQESQIVTEIDSESSENIRRRYSVSTLRRRAFSSESINLEEIQSYKPPKIAKTLDERRRLEKSLGGNPLFTHFEKEDCEIIYDAMFSVSYQKGDVIIRQGDKGDNFYIIDVGTCEVYVKFDQDHEEMVKVCRVGDTFGELALMYGTPRAATVKCASDAKLWAIDRLSYRKIIMGQTMLKRDMYEQFLKKVPLLLSMDSYERLTIADALVPQNFQVDDLIIRQGDVGASFFIIIEGEAQAWKKVDGHRVDLITLKKGDYFGELALLLNQPRAANVSALTTLKTVSLDSSSFKMLLGPVETILKRNLENYEYFMRKNSH